MTNLTGIKSLALYHYQSCPFCSATRDVIEQLGLNIELRDIDLHVEHFIDLVRGGGKPQVPCLRIEREVGPSEWLYESDDIIQILHAYAEQATNAA